MQMHTKHDVLAEHLCFCPQKNIANGLYHTKEATKGLTQASMQLELLLATSVKLGAIFLSAFHSGGEKLDFAALKHVNIHYGSIHVLGGRPTQGIRHCPSSRAPKVQ